MLERVTGRTQTFDRVRRLLEEKRFAALATHGDGQSYASLVAFAASPDLRLLTFATLSASRKFANLAAEPRVALLIDDRTNQESDLHDALAITATGRAAAVEGDERAALASLLVRKHPSVADFVASPGCVIVRVEVETYHLATRFQTVDELRPGSAGQSSRRHENGARE